MAADCTSRWSAAAGVAVLLPNFALLTGLTGAVGNNLLAFVFVPLFYFERRRQLGHWRSISGALAAELLLCAVLFAFGLGLLLLSTTSTLRSAFGGAEHHD